MKKQLFTWALIFFAGTSLMAQEQRQRLTPEERAKAAMEKIQVLQLTPQQTASTDSVLVAFFTAQQKQREEMRASGQMPDRDAMREMMKARADERNAALKKIFTDAQYKKWVDEVEPSLRPQRGGGGPQQ